MWGQGLSLSETQIGQPRGLSLQFELEYSGIVEKMKKLDEKIVVAKFTLLKGRASSTTTT